MTPPDPPDILPETVAAERLRQHLEEIARERDRAHRALQEREAELARIQRIARVGGLEIDFRDGVRNRRSPEYLLVHGLTVEAVNETYSDWVSRIHPDDRERTVKHLFGVLRGASEDYSAEYRIIRPNDGDIRWIRVVAKIERDRGGRALRLVGADLDVTAQMLAQATLRESEERFRLIADSAPVPVWVTKLDRTRSFANQAYLDFLGLPFEQAVVFDWRKALHPDDLPRILAQAVCAGGALQKRDRRMALAALGVATALGPDRQTYRLHRRRPRHHRGQAGRERTPPVERDAGAADLRTHGPA
jgi:PAS domain S-box-containing protein